MYKPCYNVFKQNLENLELRFMACNSFFVNFKTKDPYKNPSKIEHSFDFNNLVENQKLFSIRKKDEQYVFV